MLRGIIEPGLFIAIPVAYGMDGLSPPQKISGMVEADRVKPREKPLSHSELVQFFIRFDKGFLGQIACVLVRTGNAVHEVEDGLLVSLNQCAIGIRIPAHHGTDSLEVVKMIHDRGKILP